ncbi:heme biosynthesis HemY N-terminal domain-containing protein [Chromatiaceae bacterium AAb-1]|nr:heme biosynthesis HemY N-terminal domain-containing protein [Chromatiaceae bacterium AAb-1]
MMRWGLLILVLALAMVLGPLIANNPGYIKVVLAGRSFEMTAVGLLLVLTVTVLALWFVVVLLKKLLRLQHISVNFLRWRRQRKAQQAFELGMQAYAKQQWRLASDYLNRATADRFMAAEKRMLASYAAFYAGETQLAAEHVAALPAESANRWFVEADLMLQQGKAAEASNYLAEKVAAQLQDSGLGQLYLYALQQAGQWQQLLTLVPQALQYHWFTKVQWQQQRFKIYPSAISQLSQQQAFSEKSDYWQALPAKERKSSAALAGRAWALAQAGQPEQAEALLYDALDLDELPLLWPYLKKIPLGRSVLKLRKQIQHWLHTHESNGYLYAVLAYLAQQEGELRQADIAWQKARQYQPDLQW